VLVVDATARSCSRPTASDKQIKSPTNADIVYVGCSADVADIVVADSSHLSTIDRGGY
jgi:hypothetical protein